MVMIERREEVVGHPDPRIPPGPVRAGDVGEEAEGEVRLGLEVGQRPGELLAGDGDRDLVPGQEDVREPLAEPLGELVRGHARVPRFWIFSCSWRMPYISISGRGGHPGT